MSNNFCHYLTNQTRIEYGHMKPCCWFRDRLPIDDKIEVSLFREKLANISNWEDADGACDECRTRERLGSFSPRLESFNYPDKEGIRLEIQIDRDCNGACLICGPWNSNTWEKYNAKINNIPIGQITDTDVDTLSQINKLKKILSLNQYTDIRFLGGEPLRNNHHVKLLNEVTHPENITLNYITNGSYRPSLELLEFWRSFKQVKIQFSIDGTGEHFNYLRWPLQWHQVEDNIRYIIEYGQKNIILTKGSYTVTPLSLYYHDRYVADYEKFVESIGQPLAPWFKVPWQPRGVTPMELSAIPPALAKIISEKYGPDHAVTKLLVQFSLTKHVEFKRYINKHDHYRQTNWRKVFPEMEKFYSQLN